MQINKKTTGLSEQEVLESRSKYGENILTPPKRDSLWKLFFEKFNDPIIKILLVAVALSLVVSIVHNEYAETIGIFVAICLATGIGFWFEASAHKRFNLLNQVSDDVAVKVVRNSNVREVMRKEVVVGDIVVLETGDEIPADGLLLESISLQANESNLTGEPIVRKTTNEADFNTHATYPSNMLLRGTTVVEGHGMMEVSHVGDATEFGKVAQESGISTNVKSPLDLQLEGLAKYVGRIGGALAILAFLVMLTRNVIMPHVAGTPWFSWDQLDHVLQAFMVAVTLIVVAVPEGLPMSVTLSLALNMKRMLKTNNLVRKMHACETMGATTVICTDKTGTLTRNQMRVNESNFFALQNQQIGEVQNDLLIVESIASNSTAHLDTTDLQKPKTIGNPTEAALLLWLHSQKQNYLEFRENAKVIDQLSFSTERKYMATLVESDVLKGKRILYIKGAPEMILSKCSTIQEVSGTSALSEKKADIEKRLLDYQNKAMRTLGFGYKIIDNSETRPIADIIGNDCIFLGFVAISDPVRDDVPAAVSRCLSAGVGIKIVTGDTPATAREIARQIGIWNESDQMQNLITGPDFAALSDEEAFKRVKHLKIMCRARPSDKQRLVQLLQKHGEVVAVTGDGTNDAPALNYANVGLAMGSGTSVAKEASDITLLDDSFNSIATAVMWGRSLYQNIQRFVLFQLTINVSAILLVFLGTLLGRELPITVTQMLWINLIMDTFAAGALASLPPDPSVMKNKPRKNTDFIVTKKMMTNILGLGIGFVVFLLGLLYYFSDSDGNISRYNLSMFFTVFVFLQFWNLFNAKAYPSKQSAFSGMGKSLGFILVLALIIVGQVLIVQFGGEVFRTVPLALNDWLLIFGATSVILWIGEIIRLIKRLLHRN